MNSILIKPELVRFQNSLVQAMVTFGYKHNDIHELNLQRLGSEYGGWWIPDILLKNSRINNGTCISCGIGSDITFDIELQKRNFRIIALDPLQSSCDFATANFPSLQNVTIINRGLWIESGSVPFFSPKNFNHDSWSINNSHLNKWSEIKSMECVTLQDILEIYSISDETPNCILKMDIEGAEIAIIDSIVDLKFRFDYLCIELDYLSLIPFKNLITRIKRIWQVRNSLNLLEKKGYALCFTENYNFFWIKRENLRGGGGI